MIHWIWGGMIIASTLYAAFTGQLEALNEAIFEGARQGVQVTMMLLAFIVFWLGILKVAEEAGLLQALAWMLRPLIRFLFPDIPRGHPAEGYILSNMSANFFGLGNAATPMGIKAMQALKTLSTRPERASRSMITLLAINTASITIVPSTVIAYRMAKNSANPAEIVVPALLASSVGTVAAILIDKFYQKRYGP
ncbi:MAG: nucleoside recognition protein [Candidatus Carbobacillus altaicus]|uniref:Spore maturation protein A n=1 Tax=Candidatus Carbonibacillus altaicus TaxID=2163959 RepID=A0A2R6XZP5_9BACL|nr:nucleoside recognition protein [Candidatus Carbobacillus altaicus]PTQ55899.1 MAG: Spore maturation protein A [Candidatus Carbobacillus altaicus]PTQ55961.1 MAG: Spore maturation protein A [Candidatus Carbobacillus altaicus]